VFEHALGGRAYVVFGFSDGETRLEYTATSRSFTYLVDSKDGGVTIKSTGPDPDVFSVVRKDSTHYVVTVTDSSGMIAWRYAITGPLRHSDPLIAVANFELLTGGPDLSPVLWPFIGGSPK
jgi:hypothetical protein